MLLAPKFPDSADVRSSRDISIFLSLIWNGLPALLFTFLFADDGSHFFDRF